MSADTDASPKKHRIRKKNEVVQLNDFFEELNEEYEEELRMRQNSGANVDETALLGDREIPFQFEDEDDDESESIADDSASDTGSVASDVGDAGSDSNPEPSSKPKRLRKSSDTLRKKESTGNIKITTISADTTSHGGDESKAETSATSASTSNGVDKPAPAASAPRENGDVKKEDAVAAVQRSTSFVGSQTQRPSMVNKLRSFWEQSATTTPTAPTLTRTTSVSAAVASPVSRPASVSVSVAPAPVSPTPATAAATGGAAAPVRKWAPVDARPAMAMAISVPGDRSTVAPNSMVRATSVVGLPGRNPSPSMSPSRVPSAAGQPVVSPRHDTPGRRDNRTTPQTEPAETPKHAEQPQAVTPRPDSETAPAAATTKQPEEKPVEETKPVEDTPKEAVVEKPAAQTEQQTPSTPTAETPTTTQGPQPAEPAEPEPKKTKSSSSDDKAASEETTEKSAEPAADATTTTAVDSIDLVEAAKAVTSAKASDPITPPSPSKPRRSTRTDSKAEKDKSGDKDKSAASATTIAVAAGDNSSENSTPAERRKKRTSEKRKKPDRSDSTAGDSGTEDSTSGNNSGKDKKSRRKKTEAAAAAASDDDAIQEASSTPALVESAEIKTKKRRKKLTSTTPGGTPTKRVSTKKIKKTASVAADPPKSDSEAQRDAALASAGVAPKEIDKLKQFFATWNSKDLMHTWEIDPTEIEFVERIGEGTSCSVYRGTYRGQEVALKVLKDINQKQLTNFTKEFDIISQFRSPYVVFFFGACIEPIPVMVLGFCRKGSLFHVLNNPNENITWDLVLKICLQTLRGLDSMHNWKPQIVHRDLKSRNILVEDDWNTKLCDFGESRYTQGTNLETLCKVRGTYAYIAPEVYFGQSFVPKSDVYAFGVILWELCNRCIKGKYDAPFSEYKSLIYDFQIIVQASRKGLRPTIDPKVPQALQNVIRLCWDHEPENRPETSYILHFFEEIIAEPNQKKWLEVKHAPIYPPPNGVGKPGAAPKSS
eukprot:TRINITY_DN352_c0_g1_i2.p1 TRINITY_DN352_c0_g1~~TRINITY_DN352_c0_g1_i2.p1  ORF type:complete len:996 (+),score=291.25 TRINITY_DN352_c0_g1_i2:1728-4715(+)